MKVTVKSVEDAAFTGSDGAAIPSAKVTFEHEGTTKTLQTYIPPVVTQALSWQPGQEVEIEEYTDKKGKRRFKTPQAKGSGGSGAGGGRWQPDPTKDAVQAAVALAQTAWRLPEGATENRSPDQAQGAADRMLAFVENAIPRILKATQGEGAGGVVPPSVTTDAVATPPPSQPVQESGANPSEGNAPAPAPKAYRLDADSCPHANVVDAPRPGFKMCPDCGRAGPARYFEKETV